MHSMTAPDPPRALTSAERQARRREQFRRMRAALERIAEAKTAEEARRIAADALGDGEPKPRT